MSDTIIIKKDTKESGFAKFLHVILLPITSLKKLWYRWLVFMSLTASFVIYTTLVILGKASLQRTVTISVYRLVGSYLLLFIIIVGMSIAYTLISRKNVVHGE